MSTTHHASGRGARRIAGLIAAAVAGSAALAGCGQTDVAPVAEHRPAMDKVLHERLPDAIRQRGVLVVGTDPSYAPMSSYARDGRRIVGMEPDLANALGDVLGVKVKIRDVAFEKLTSAVDDGSIDIALSAMTDTPERAKTVDFVDYFRAGTAILVQRGNPRHISSLRSFCGRDVAVERGTVQVDLLEHQQSLCGSRPVRILQFADNTDALLRLRTGRVDAVLTDLPPAALLANGTRTRQFYELATRDQYDPGPYGLVVRKHDQRMLGVMTDAVSKLLADGEYARILKRWNLQAGAVDEVLVDSGR